MTDEEFMQHEAQEIREKIKGAAYIFGIPYDHDNPDHQLVVAYALGIQELAVKSTNESLVELLQDGGWPV